ncbi:YtxH domain-containing protein [bacterium]|nr:YtxH domain-containing protein [bacterium]
MDRNLISGIITGMAIGLLVAIFTAPEEGFLFRNRIKALLEGTAKEIGINTGNTSYKKKQRTSDEEDELH